MATAPISPEREHSTHVSPEHTMLIVQQPRKLEAILAEIEHLSETAPTKIAEDGGATTGNPRTATGKSPPSLSPREHALANLPPAALMQRHLQKHIHEEMKKLRREAGHVVHPSKPGAAFQLNCIYARIRRLSALLAEIWEASYEVLRRMFIRIFIDKQTTL